MYFPLAGILSIPVDFVVLSFRITEKTSAVQILVNVNVDLSEVDWELKFMAFLLW
jgi:hypothetical protein